MCSVVFSATFKQAHERYGEASDQHLAAEARKVAYARASQTSNHPLNPPSHNSVGGDASLPSITPFPPLDFERIALEVCEDVVTDFVD